jgi:hypothetical protein
MSDLKYIIDHFNKLFVECKDGVTFVAPSFTASNDLDALVVLNKIVQIATEYRFSPKDVKNIVSLETLQKIIHIKCTEFCDKYDDKSNIFSSPYNKPFNYRSYDTQPQQKKDVENFKKTFYSFVNSLVDDIVKRIN